MFQISPNIANEYLPFALEYLKKYINSDIAYKKHFKDKQNKVEINFINKDMSTYKDKKYDVIISNPPYIKYDEEIMDIVKNNEPNIALYAEDNGLYFYKDIIKNAKKNLKRKSIIAFEIGMEQGNDIKEYALKYFPKSKILIEKDYNDRNRFVFIINE